MYTVHLLAGQFMIYDRVTNFSLKSWVLTCGKWKMKLPLPRIRLKFLLPCGRISGFCGTWLIPTANCRRFGHGKPAVLMSLRNVATVMTYLISGASTSWQSSVTNRLHYNLYTGYADSQIIPSWQNCSKFGNRFDEHPKQGWNIALWCGVETPRMSQWRVQQRL